MVHPNKFLNQLVLKVNLIFEYPADLWLRLITRDGSLRKVRELAVGKSPCWFLYKLGLQRSSKSQGVGKKKTGKISFLAVVRNFLFRAPIDLVKVLKAYVLSGKKTL